MSRNKQLAVAFSVMDCATLLLVIILTKELGSAPGMKQQADNEPHKVTVTLKAVGDNLIHFPIYNSCKTECIAYIC